MNSKTLTYPMTKSIEKACILIVAILLPILFHAFSIPGTIFLPIYLSILIASYWLNPFAALALAGLTPVANYLLTGMPPIVPLPMLQILIFEMVFLSASVTLLKRTTIAIGFQLVLAVLLTRAFSLLLLPFFGNVSFIWWWSNFLMGVPGVIMNVALAYLIVGKLYKK